MFPTPSKSNESPRMDLNSVLNDREKTTMKTEKCDMEDESEIKFEPYESPEWIKTESNNPSSVSIFLFTIKSYALHFLIIYLHFLS